MIRYDDHDDAVAAPANTVEPQYVKLPGETRICLTHSGFDLSRFTYMEVELCFQMPPEHNGPRGGHSSRN